MKILVWHFTLRPTLRLNALVGDGDRTGVLLRADGGVGCLQPWPELGDAPLDAQLDALRAGRPTALGARTLQCAAIDGAARRAGRWLFEGLEIPRSHVIAGTVDEREFAGFPAVKLKCGPDAEAEAERVRALIGRVSATTRLRLDFNESLHADDYRKFVAALPADVIARIDFVEDPLPYDAAAWAAMPEDIPLAVDRAAATARGGFAVRVVKPAAHDVVLWDEPVVITSSMDHPIGQVFAAYEAATYSGELLGAGLLTHWCYEPEVFGERLAVEHGRLRPPCGTGLGFDDLLAALPWSPLK